MQIYADWDRLLDLLTGRLSAGAALTDADGERLVRLAQRLGVAPLLYDRLTQQGGITLPPDPWEHLRAIYLRTAMRNTRLYHYLGPVLAALKAADVPVILLKGAYLARDVYANIALRPMGDVDLLVPPDGVPRTLHVLKDLGYISNSSLLKLRFPNAKHCPPLVKDGEITLEVHGTSAVIDLPRRMSHDEYGRLWARARSFTVGDQQALVLAPEDQLLSFCAHAAIGHRYVVDLRPFFDIAMIIRRQQGTIDWEALSQRAQRWGIAHVVNLTFSLAQRWANAAIPAALPTEPPAPGLVAYLREKVLNAPREDLTIHFSARDGKTDRLREIVTLDCAGLFGYQEFNMKTRPLVEGLVPPRRMMARHYPWIDSGAGRLALAYPFRLLDLTTRYLQVLWCYCRGTLAVQSPLREERALRRLLFHTDTRGKTGKAT